MDSLSVQEYVQDILLGSGIQATNISYSGCLHQIGYLQNANELGYGLNSGLVLGTEHVFNVLPDEQQFMDTFECPTSGGDPDLLTIAGSVPPLIGEDFNVSSVNEQSILEFDFTPTGDTLRFRYIFASSEYNAFENSNFNDVFAFLLSGPGISGPYAAPAGFPDGAMNIAVVPNSDPALPITISSVNFDFNSEFYVDNSDVEPWQPDGFTVVLEAVAEVICGETYHIKLAIADGTDSQLGSWVVLEEGSFSSNAVVDVDLSINVGGPNAGVVFEDCGEAQITFTRAPESPLDVEDMITITWGGSATMGVDYNEMPDTIIFAPGVQSVVYTIDAVMDGTIEGAELVELDILNLGACGGSGLVSNFSFFIADEPEPLVVEGWNQTICNGITLELEPIITGGYGNFVFDWSTGQNTPTIEVTPGFDTSYNVVVSDTCGMPPADADFIITVLQLPPLEVEITNGDVMLECGGNVEFVAATSGGDSNYTYEWENGEGDNLWGFGNTLFYSSWNGSGTVIVTVTDGCNFSVSDSVNVTLNVPPLSVDVPTSLSIPCNTNFDVVVSPVGGEGPFNYSWILNGNWDWNFFGNTYTLNANEPGVLEVSVGDACGQNVSVEMPFTITSAPVTFDVPSELTGTCATIFQIQPTNIVSSGTVTYSWQVNGVQVSTQPIFSDNFDENSTVLLILTDACSQTGQGTTDIILENPAINLSLGPDVFGSCLDETLFSATISGGSGSFEYAWAVADTLFGTTATITVQSFETIPVSLTVTDACGTQATDQLNYNIPNIPITFIQHPDTVVCPGTNLNLFAIASGGEGGFSYAWTGNSADTSHVRYNNVFNSMLATITATDICGKEESTTINVTVSPVEASFNSQEIDTDRYLFTDLSTTVEGVISQEWFADGELVGVGSSIEHQFDGLGESLFTLRATNEIGCWDTISRVIFSSPLIYVPSAFTPNGDGINDVFIIEGNSVREFEFRVFDRWGNVVFESTEMENPWLGDFQSGDYYVSTGIYSYTLKVIGFRNEVIERVGTIQVVR